MAHNYVLVVRDPDSPTEIYTDGDVETVSIDLGSSFNGTPDNDDQAIGFVEAVIGQLAHVPVATNTYRYAIMTLAATVENFPEASKRVAEFDKRRKAQRTMADRLWTIERKHRAEEVAYAAAMAGADLTSLERENLFVNRIVAMIRRDLAAVVWPAS